MDRLDEMAGYHRFLNTTKQTEAEVLQAAKAVTMVIALLLFVSSYCFHYVLYVHTYIINITLCCSASMLFCNVNFVYRVQALYYS